MQEDIKSPHPNPLPKGEGMLVLHSPKGRGDFVRPFLSIMNINFSSAFQSVQAMPQTQAAGVGAHQPKTMPSAGNIKDEYVPSQSDSSGAYKLPAPIKSLSLSSFEARAEKHSTTLSGRVQIAYNQTLDKVFESIGLEDKAVNLRYAGTNGGVVFTGGVVFPPGATNGIPLTSEQNQAIKEALKTTIFEGKSLAEWDATPKHAKDWALYYEGDPELGTFVSFGRKDSTAQPSFFASLFEMQKASSPMEELMNNPVREMMEELDRLLEEAELRRRAKASDDSPTDGETLSATLDGEEELEVDTEGSDIGGEELGDHQLPTSVFDTTNP